MHFFTIGYADPFVLPMVPPGAMAFARTMGAAETEELVTLEALEAGWRGLSVVT